MKTFLARGTDINAKPIALTNSFAEEPAKATQWRGFIRKNRLTNVSQDLGEVIKAIDEFLGPIAKSLALKQPFRATWEAPGPWVQ